jgi:colanic acid/amylovoran biosynthesis glycosyltransferase
MKTVLIFRTQLLPPSETFIRGQAETMRKFRPYFVGWRRVNGLELPAESCWVANTGGLLGRIREFDFRLRGPSSESISRLRRLCPSLIHAHFGPDACQAMRSAGQLGLPLVATFHGYDATMHDSALRQWPLGRQFVSLRPQLQRQGKLFIAVSDFIRGRLLALGFPPERVVVHYTGVDTETFRVPESNNRVPLVLFVARLVEKKGCTYLLKAMTQVQTILPNAELVIIGDGPQRQELEREARESLRNVRFLGSQSPEIVKDWMVRASVFCVPSITASNGDSEGFGMVFAEAQACGTPVVSFATGGIPEAVAHGHTGFLAPERDWAKLGEYILLLLQDRSLWKDFSEAGRQRVENNFNLRKQTAILEDIYAGLISSESRSGIPIAASASTRGFQLSSASSVAHCYEPPTLFLS